ncbi:methylase, partial [Streptococcus mutans KK23]
MVQGIDMPQVARMYPHLFKGEGQFIAKLRDRRTSRTVPVKSARNRLKREQEQLWQDFAHK